MNGEVTKIWEEKEKIQIGEEWFTLAPHVKLSYVKVGPVSYSVDKENKSVITYITSKVDGSSYQNAPKPADQTDLPVPTVKPGVATNYKPTTYNDSVQESIVKQMSVKAAIEIIKIQNALGEEKLKPTMKNIFVTAKIVKSIVDADWENDTSE